MAEQFEVFYSNRLEILYQNLKKSLFGSVSYPLARRLIIVYGPAMKNWLMLRMAQDEELSVATGLEFVYLNQTFDTLLHLFQAHPLHIPNELEIALAIEKELKYFIYHFHELEEKDQSLWLPILSYLKIEKNSLSHFFCLTRKMEKRLIGLSQLLAQHFRDYGRYAPSLMQQWETSTLTGWQQQLWQRLFNGSLEWSYPCREFKRDLIVPPHYEIHFFSISFINRSEFEFLGYLARQTPVYYYALSPCAVFWSDIRSDKEASHLQMYWQQRLGKESSRVLQLEELLQDRNPLLANFGRLGREMAVCIEEQMAQCHSLYVLPSHVQELDPDFALYDDLHLEETHAPLTLLHAIQADMLLMRNPQELSPIELKPDDSIQMHIAPTLQREVQILYHNVLKLIEKEQGNLQPCDIIVMAPTIADYTPYIQTIFGSPESQLDFQILDLGMHIQNEMVQGFLQLLALSESRWDVTHLLQLFGHRALQRRFHLSQSDYYTIRDWIEKAGIRWGDDLQHRNELLERHHCQNRMIEQTGIGTWDYGLTRLLTGLTTNMSSSSLELDTLPCDHIDFSQGDLLGQWIRLLHALRDDLAPLHDRSQMTLSDWTDYLVCLLDHYFQPDLNDEQSIEDYEDLKDQFERLRAASKSFKETTYSFQTVKMHLQNLMKHKGIVYRENQVQTVRFCSMMPLRSIPAKVVALLGMQEGGFPRPTHSSSLNLMLGQELAHYCPSATDLDRYLFLESLHSASDYLLISYQGYNYKEAKEYHPSLVIEELFSYLDKFYTLEGKKPSDTCTYLHPFDSFHESYFQSDSRLPNYSLRDYRAAQVYYKTDKQAPHRFIQEFILTVEPELAQTDKSLIIELKHLLAAVRNPIKFHLNQALDIYIEKEEDRQIKNDEEFSLSALDKYVLKQSALKEPIRAVLNRAEKEGKMPFGLFKEVASRHLKEEADELQQRLQKHQLSRNDLFQIEFCSNCTKPIQFEPDYWLIPAPSLTYENGRTIQIVGKLPYVTTKGLIVLSRGSLTETWKAWPQFLLYLYATSWHPDKLDHQLIMTHAAQPKAPFFDDPFPYLKQLIDYYHVCLKTFSPLMPDWIPAILKGDINELQEKMQQTFSVGFGEYPHHDLRWILHKDYLPNSQQIIEKWQEQAEFLLADLVHHWHPNKVSNGGKEE